MAPSSARATAATLLVVLAVAIPALSGLAVDTIMDVASRPPVVLAYTDDGINPYHLAFREPSWTAHPSTYIPGYPTDATALHLSLGAETYEEAITRDQHIWDNIEAYKLYYVPGTRIVGMITAMDWNGPFPILDETGHGTAVIDAGSGRWNGMAPNTAIVSAVVSGGHLRPWVADQLWIDMVSNSRGCLITNLGGVQVDLPTGSTLDWSWSPVHSSYKIHQQGRLSFNGAGNGYMVTNAWCDHMAPWNVVIGEVGNWREAHQTYDRHPMVDPPFELGAPAFAYYATHDSINETRWVAGTSIASPIAMGYAARLVDLARERLDHEGGFVDGKYAVAGPRADIPARGPLANGELDAEDIRRLLYTSAAKVRVTGTGASWVATPVLPPEEVAYLYSGYGGIGRETFDTAVRILMGEEEPEPRPYHDYWHHQIKSTQWEYWDFLRCKAHYDPSAYTECTGSLGDYADPQAPPLPLPGGPG